MVRTWNSKEDCVEECKTFPCCNEEFMIYPNNTREPLKYFKQSSDEIQCIASNILMAEERKNEREDTQVVWETHSATYPLFSFLKYDHWALSYSESTLVCLLSTHIFVLIYYLWPIHINAGKQLLSDTVKHMLQCISSIVLNLYLRLDFNFIIAIQPCFIMSMTLIING